MLAQEAEPDYLFLLEPIVHLTNPNVLQHLIACRRLVKSIYHFRVVQRTSKGQVLCKFTL